MHRALEEPPLEYESIAFDFGSLFAFSNTHSNPNPNKSLDTSQYDALREVDTFASQVDFASISGSNSLPETDSLSGSGSGSGSSR